MTRMKLLLACVAVFAVGMVFGFVVHGTLLRPDYLSVPQLNRPAEEQEAYLPFLLLGYVFYSVAFVWIFSRGVEAKPWFGQGVRYGIAVWALASVPSYLVHYAAQPWPGSLVVKQIGFDFVSVSLLGVIAAALCRK